MSRLLIASIIVASLSTIVGCGASSGATRPSTMPSNDVADTRDDSSWTPPEAMEGAIVSQGAREASSHQSSTSTSYRPNRERRPTHGAIHAATY
jgi:hypothetical protein